MEWYLSVALLMMIVAGVMLAAEFFAPTGGLLVVAAVAILAAAVGLVFLYGTRTEGMLAVVAMCLGLPLAGYFLFLGYKQLALDPKVQLPTASEALAEEIGIANLNDLINSYGKTLSTMRPSGIVELEGRRLDAMTEGRMLEAGTPIRCVGVRGTVIVVRPYDAKPNRERIEGDELGETSQNG